MVILVDISGSMLGQRYEIAKQTIETILETLSENDYVNIILVRCFNFFPEAKVYCTIDFVSVIVLLTF